MKHQIKFLLLIVFIILPFLNNSTFVIASDTNIQEEINVKKAQIDQINKKIDEYRTRINQYSNETANLTNDLEMIENQIALAELDISATENRIETQKLEVAVLDESIKEQEDKIINQRAILEDMIFELNKNDDIDFIKIIFSANNFNELFTTVVDLETVNSDLQNTLNEAHNSKEQLDKNKIEEESKLDDLLESESELKLQVDALNDQMGSKNTLIEQTKASESGYRVLMSELRQEQQYITNQITSLQNKISDKLISLDEDNSQTIISWPTRGIITAIFHDPNYPFRHLFEHSGLDIAVPTGTPIKSAAPGYVAWARTGKSYGNYIMVIHANGYATLYAHLSSMNVTADQYVSRGQIIGYSGSTGFSTGPHLHFEVRVNGIPVDPQLYLTEY